MHIWRGLIVALTVAALAGPAAAQIKPKILIVFDTSGSMLQNSSGTWQTGDGSQLCSNQGQQTRIYKLKAALFDALQGMGALEVDFALQTFPMFVDPTRTPLCPLGTTCQNQPSCAGHYYTTSATVSEIYSGRYGCKISTHAATTQTNGNCGASSNPCSAWYANLKKEVIKVPFAGTTPEKVMWYFDQKEDTNKVAPLSNPEIRAGNGWYTPLGKSLFYAHGYFHKEVVLPASDYRKKCERLVVALFTDGAETCNTTSSNAFYPTKWSTNLYNNMKVVTHTVAIDISNSLLSSIASTGHGTYYNVSSNTTALKAAFLDIIAKSLPPSETCNGLDDDCDKAVDEDFPLKGTACHNGKLGICYKTGVYVCNSAGTGVVCNAPNATGTAEKCNLLDDDCDGLIDEGLTNCQPVPCQPEICNNIDDDCDGKVDEGIPSIKCGKDIGECKPGLTKCIKGKMSCDGGTGPVTETCNGLDDDCDGARDGMSDQCYSFASGCTPKASGSGFDCVGFCKPGLKICTAQQTAGVWKGVWGTCQGDVGPGKEVCNGLDDDCDGLIDEDAECPGGSKCVNGACTNPCSGGEFGCPAGQFCKEGWCIPDPCDPTTCPEGHICKAGACFDVCKNVTCGKYEKCVKGACVDQSCYNPKNKCKAGETCIQGECKADPCYQVTCASDEYCSAGVCVQSCATVQCPSGELCKLVAGKATCVEDPCAKQTCGGGTICLEGKCVEDPCNLVHCDTGKICDPKTAACINDPCEQVTCPTHFTCDRGMCVSTKVASTKELLGTGGGGIACSLGDGPAAPWASWPLIGLLFFFLLRIRRSSGTSTSTRRD
jgi:MYXO-CTERM domain-containing protein